MARVAMSVPASSEAPLRCSLPLAVPKRTDLKEFGAAVVATVLTRQAWRSCETFRRLAEDLQALVGRRRARRIRLDL